ncbi:MAG: glycosyl transferase [Crocinitomicaceae bacterium]|nr:glycosyl transferase [Crocinitomicaceae bacterium]|tara:strand:+ start:23029 stop:24021 length:993 start_codon:yes stop_codon:yes gene_type:complete
MAPKILIIRFSSIGDIVLTTPVIRIAKQQVEGAEVHLVTKKVFYPVVEANSYLDKVHVLNDDLNTVIKALKEERFTHLIDLHNNLRSRKIKKALKLPTKSFTKLNIEKWLAVNFKQIHKLPNIHIVDRYLETLSEFNVKNDQKGLDYFIPEKDRVDLKKLPQTHQNGYLAWVIGGSYTTKMLPSDKVVEVLRRIEKPVVLLGGPEDAENGKLIAGKLGSNVFDACGKFNINQSASLVKQASKVLSNDTGLMHVAAAFNKPTLSFWGNTIPEFGMYPYMPQHPERSTIMQVADLRCRPCSKLGYKKCPKKHFYCMKLIDADKVVEWVSAKL